MKAVACVLAVLLVIEVGNFVEAKKRGRCEKLCADGSTPDFTNLASPCTDGSFPLCNCDDGSRPACPDGSEPSRPPPCADGSTPTCQPNADAAMDDDNTSESASSESESSEHHHGKKPKCPSGEAPTCADGTLAQFNRPCDGNRPVCADGSSPRRG